MKERVLISKLSLLISKRRACGVLYSSSSLVIMKHTIILIIAASLTLLPTPAFAEVEERFEGLEIAGDDRVELSPEARAYFTGLHRDTWNYLGTFVEKLTGVPYDSSARQPVTSISNVGFYLAAIAIAYETNIISMGEALERTERAMTALEKLEKWRGFPQPWFLVRSLKPSHGDEFSYASHLSVLLGGLVVVENTFPEMKDRVREFIGQMRFSNLYEVRNGWLKGGYNTDDENFAVYQAWGHWYYKYFAGESRLLSFYGIARNGLPESHWDSLIRPMQEGEGEVFFVSNQEEPGLSIQYLAGLFLDERELEMGQSQRSFARYQMKQAKAMESSVWGWASCESPRRRYLTSGELRPEIVTPHASILASIYYPKEAYQNLLALEDLGARPAGQQGVLDSGYGFRDSVNWTNGEVARNHLTASQGMAFLALSNLLYEGIVWRTFESDKIVKRGLTILDLRPSLSEQGKIPLETISVV